VVPPEEKNKDALITQELKEDHAKDSRVYKVLLLGPGESGKSTVFKQMVMNYGSGFKTEDRTIVRGSVLRGLVSGVSQLLKESPGIGDADAVVGGSLSSEVALLRDSDTALDRLTPEMVAALKKLAEDSSFRKLLTYKSKFHIPESLDYFLGRLNSLAQTDYIPTDEDMVRVRIRTTGMMIENFSMGKDEFQIMDVGGQRSERKKWLSAFDGVTAILFIAAASEYDQVVWEDEKTNRMDEALNVFQQILDNPTFASTPIVLFLNKADLFEKKVKNVSLSVCFPDWDKSKDGDIDAAWNFLESKFNDRNLAGKQVFVHRTTATNAENIKAVWNVIVFSVISKSLSATGIM